MHNIKKDYNRFIYDLLLGIVTSSLFSAFIYFEHFGIGIKIINSIFGIVSLALLLYIPKRAVLTAGFLIGILWFYWIGYSFKYNGIHNMETVITILFGIIYMLFFGVLALTDSVILRAILLFGLSFVEPMDFNWLQIELLFIDSYFGILKYQLAIILITLSLPRYIKRPYGYGALLFLVLALDINTHPVTKEAPLKIKLVSTNIKQDEKWEKENLSATLELIFYEIEKARKDGYDMVVLPESVFPFYMNKAPLVSDRLKKISYEITIVAGSLLKEDGKHYNVTYIFSNGEYDVAKKLVLVPFGEYIPLPEFARKFVNDTFFAGASDFKTGKKATDFIVKDVKFRNAICYEATCQEIYDGDVEYVVAISNNAWFAPSIEPTLQRLLMRYYAKKNSVVIYHSANYKGSGVIK